MPQLVGVGRLMGSPKRAAAVTGPFDALNATNPIRCFLGARRAVGTYTGSAYTLTRSSDSATRTFNVEATAAEVAAWGYALGACILYYTQFFDITGNATAISAGTTGGAGTAPTADLGRGAYPCIVFNGTTNRVLITGLVDFTGANKTLMTISAAFRSTATIASTLFIFFFSVFSSGNTSRMSIGTTGTPNWLARWLRTDAGSSLGNVSAGTPDQLPHVLTQQVDTVGDSVNGTTRACLDGTLNTAVSFASLPTGHSEGNSAAVAWGNSASSANWWKGESNSILAIPSKPTLATVNAAHVAYNANPPAATLSIDETAWGGLIGMPAGITFGRIFQRDAGLNTTSIAVSGKWRGIATKVQYRLKDAVTLATVRAATDLDAAPSAAGTYSGTIALAPLGVYYVGVSTSDDPSTVVWSNAAIGVGMGALGVGQSNESKFAENRNAPGAGQTVADLHTRRYTGAVPCGHYLPDLVAQPDENITSTHGLNGQWGGEGPIRYMNAVYAGNGSIPIFYIAMGINGTGSLSWAQGGTSYVNMTTNLARANMTAQFEEVHIDNGEGDSVGGLGGAAYIVNWTSFINGVRTLTGRATLRVGFSMLCQDTTASDANIQDVKVNGIRKMVKDNVLGNLFMVGNRSAQPWNIAQGGDSIHHTPNMYGSFGCLRATATLKQLGLATYGADGPEFTSMTATVSSQTVKFIGVLDGGTRIVDAAGGTVGSTVTGIRVLVNGVVKTPTSLAFSGTADLIATFAGGTFIITDAVTGDYNYGNASGLNAIYDNNAVPGDTVPGRPMMPTYGTLTATVGV